LAKECLKNLPDSACRAALIDFVDQLAEIAL
jgi:hypothetical protein